MSRQDYYYHLFVEDVMLVTSFLEAHGGQRFTIDQAAAYTELDHSRCQALLANNPLVNQLQETGRGPQFLSIAEPLIPTLEGLLEVMQLRNAYLDTLGREAREDFFELIASRRQQAGLTHVENFF